MGESYHIKNMVCARCISSVNQIFTDAGFEPININLGEVYLEQPLTQDQISTIQIELEKTGFEFINDKTSQLIENIKKLIIQEIHHSECYNENIQWSKHLMENVHYDYNYLSRLFSTTVGITIEQYIILQKIEKVKELLCYQELSLKEISYKLGYSSVAHLSGQFKKVTGMTPTIFKKQTVNHKMRVKIDQINK
ncbi:helix-turn-helix domain-containing protein [Robiginitalea sp. IMCC44478]|uniref:helix-turn-helix domain-containing protein n=1 Tax=Robiginitalea sp. IMCC44478 TaxID=3459122 RepID=UPI004041EE0F